MEIVENDLVHYEDMENENILLKMRFKGRLINEILMAQNDSSDEKFSGYSSLSFRELENATDERPIFEAINRQILQSK